MVSITCDDTEEEGEELSSASISLGVVGELVADLVTVTKNFFWEDLALQRYVQWSKKLNSIRCRSSEREDTEAGMQMP